MRTVVCLLLSFATAGFSPAWAQTPAPPRGTVLELHSCEVYAGGCTVSSESTLGGRSVLRAWRFSDGSFAGVDLAGCEVALLEVAGENLAAPRARTDGGVIYLPESATEAQRQALLGWVKASLPEPARATVQARVVPLRFTSAGGACTFRAGDAVSVTTAPLESCETGACGEALWYQPRTSTTAFTVAVNRTSKVIEPLLQLTWKDARKRSVFLGKFGGSDRNVFLATADLCGPSGALF